ncbi:putative gustatory receptor 28b isoform X2 [Zophobas morio]|uniref:putative gustatory receptor 28b isoform X2 n=1 Tax=Zophobas morio TaxID=2755281 RepID=UPI0030827E8D
MDVFHSPEFDVLLTYQVPRLRNFKLVTLATMVYSTTLLSFHTGIWANLGSKDWNVYAIIASFFPFNFSYLFTIVEELMYWYLVYSVKIRITALNEKIYLIGENERLHDLLMEIDKRKINSVVDTLHPHFFKPTLYKSTSATQIQKIIKAYLHLVAAKNCVNDCYGLIILTVLLGCLVHLLVTPYLLRSVLFSSDDDEIFIASQSVWMIGHVLRLVLIVEPCDGCLREIRKTSLIVCKMASVGLETDVQGSLDLLLTCLSQCELDFTAFGLTVMHRGLLTAIAGAVTTYLVILFQFN